MRGNVTPPGPGKPTARRLDGCASARLICQRLICSVPEIGCPLRYNDEVPLPYRDAGVEAGNALLKELLTPAPLCLRQMLEKVRNSAAVNALGHVDGRWAEARQAG